MERVRPYPTQHDAEAKKRKIQRPNAQNAACVKVFDMHAAGTVEFQQQKLSNQVGAKDKEQRHAEVSDVTNKRKNSCQRAGRVAAAAKHTRGNAIKQGM